MVRLRLSLILVILFSVPSLALVPFGFWHQVGAALQYVFENKLVDTVAPLARMGDASANFGHAVAISEDQSTLVVGVPNDDYDENGMNFIGNAGSVYVYIKSGGAWTFQQKLVAQGTNARVGGDTFGIAVAISGDTIAVGSTLHDYDENGANLLNSAGAVFVYTRTAGVWTQQQKLVSVGTNARTASSNLGYAVDIDGDTIIASAPNHSYDENGANALSNCGAAFVYTRTAGVWTQQQKLAGFGTNGRAASDNYGYSVAISGDTVSVGAVAHKYDEAGANAVTNAGAVYIYTRTAGVWSAQQKLVGFGTNGRVTSDLFGQGIDISGDTVAVGARGQGYDAAGANLVTTAGAVFIFTRTAGVWSAQQKLVATGTNARVASDTFGKSLSLAGDIVVIGSSAQDYDENGANLLTDAGAAFVFTRSGGVWSQVQRLVSSSPRTAGDVFGVGVAVSGNTVVIGAEAHDYDNAGVNFISAAGAAFAYDYNGSSWALNSKVVAALAPGVRTLSSSFNFGKVVAVSEDESTLVVGCAADTFDALGGDSLTAAGAAYVYIKSGGNWVLQQKLVGTGTNGRMANDNFGISVGISGDTIVVGATGQDYDESGVLSTSAGAAFVFTRTAGYWSLQQKLLGVGTNARIGSDAFGASVAISGDTIAVGATGQDYDAAGGGAAVNGAGAAFVFTRTAGVWTQQQKLVGTGTNARLASDSFGAAISISGDSIVVGSNGQDYDENGANLFGSAGAAYVFTRTAGVWSQQQKLVGTGTNARAASDLCGSNVAIDADTVVLNCPGQDTDENGANTVTSAGAAYVFFRTAGVWSQQQKLVATGTNNRVASDLFATSASISGDVIVIGATGQSYDETGANLVSAAGAVFIFKRVAGVWTQHTKLVGVGTNGRVATDSFGVACAIRGGTVLVGAHLQDYDAAGANSIASAGAAYVFKYK